MPADITLRSVSVLDIEGETVRGPLDIEITDGIISRIGQAAEAPPDARSIVDCSGLFVLPGLCDAHVHTTESGELLLFVANGVTAVRHMNGSPLHLAMERVFSGTSHLAPTVFTVSPLVDGVGPEGFPTVPHATIAPPPEQALAFVSELAARGYRQLKVYDRLTVAQHRALCAAAAEVGLPVTGHCPRSVPLERAIEHGQICFEHLSGLTRGRLIPRRGNGPEPVGVAQIVDAAARMDYAAVEALGQFMAERGVWLCPTTRVLDSPGTRGSSTVGVAPAEYLNRAFRQRWEPPATVQIGGVVTPWADYQGALGVWNETQLRCLAIVARAGVRILAGTDFPTPGAVPGFSLHEELEILVRHGITPWAALRAATADAGRFATAHLGATEPFGTVAVGCRADLVLLRGNPAADIAAIREPHAVVLRGRYRDRALIDSLLAQRHRVVSREPAVPRLPAQPRNASQVERGTLADRCGKHLLHRGAFRHYRAEGLWHVTEVWTTVGEVRHLRVDLALRPDGRIARGRIELDFGYATTTTTIAEQAESYLVTIDDPDGQRWHHKLDGPLVPSERLGWSAFAVSRAQSLASDARMWDGADETATLTVDGSGTRVRVRRPAEITDLLLDVVPGREISAVFSAQSGQSRYPRVLTLRYDITESEWETEPKIG